MPAIESKPNFVGRLSRMRSFLAPTERSFVGVDIGIDHISVTSLGPKARTTRSRKTRGSDSVHWRTSYRFSPGIDPHSAPSPQWIDQTIDSLINKLPRCVDGSENLAVLSLPLPWVHHQVVLGTELESSQMQCDGMFKNSMFQSTAHLSHWPVVGMQHGQPNQDDQYIVTATSENAACQIAQAVQDVGYHVQSILPHGVALIQAAKPLTSVQAKCVVYSNQVGGIVAMNNGSGCGLCRTLPAVPRQVLDDASDGLLSLNDIRPWLSDLAAEINATIRYSNRANMKTDSDQPILVCGDIINVPGVDAVLAKLTNQPIATWKYSGRNRPNRRAAVAAATTEKREAGDSLCALPLSLAYHAWCIANEVQP